MPFFLGEKVNLRFEGHPDTSVLKVAGVEYTVANEGLVQREDGGLIAIVELPHKPGGYDYVFTDGKGTVDEGRLRVVNQEASPQRAPSRQSGRIRPVS